MVLVLLELLETPTRGAAGEGGVAVGREADDALAALEALLEGVVALGELGAAGVLRLAAALAADWTEGRLPIVAARLAEPELRKPPPKRPASAVSTVTSTAARHPARQGRILARWRERTGWGMEAGRCMVCYLVTLTKNRLRQ